MYILGIESSCDETAVAVLRADESGYFPLSDAIHSQIPLHRLYGGVVPEIAGRAHTEAISGLTASALQSAGIDVSALGLVAVTSHPGLIGALLVGVNFAKSLAVSRGLPLVAVDHMKAHVAAASVASVFDPVPPPPYLALAVSGGHTSMYIVEDDVTFREIGATRDDAAGEAFDKVGRLLGFSYPAGAAFDRASAEAYARLCPEEPTVTGYIRRVRPHAALRLPAPVMGDGSLDFSFSGLKTAAVNLLHHAGQTGEAIDRDAFCAAFTAEVTEGICSRVRMALERHTLHGVVAAGGVSANSHLRERLRALCAETGLPFSAPPPALCGDNGLMVAAQGYREYRAGRLADSSLNASAADEP
ncbi:MAG: tRNA (adenosine(37)-N6)-threonylcarbamoyltransferase complex transferase subunit TsaD [Clostridia bacterium]|nr:tRNA (adenosine(37)-N6)-threonylcarbamoyltransferase complex transferase subunit TsaD [Clostridia bacterium]